ncbi:ATP-binding protein [Candidatus Woesearchaeota archaeon]|nr:ATP-binding protein [Candidatus Woesearchaeota archaeon]
MVEKLRSSANVPNSASPRSGTFGLRYVITGGPGVGKTTVITELGNLGYTTLKEVARQIIGEQLPQGILPWTQLAEFQLLVLERQIDLETRIHGQTVFCDRGVIDGIGYCREGNIAIPAQLAYEATHHLYTGVFVLDPLDTYYTDTERVEDAQRARTIHDLITDSYTRAGYDVIRVPVLPPNERVTFILEKIGGTHHDRNTNIKGSTCTTHAPTKKQNQ